MRLNLILLALTIISLATASSNCLCIDYIFPPMKWFNYSYDPAENVAIEINLVTLGPDPVTILTSDSGQINLSMHTFYIDEPYTYSEANGSSRDIRLGLMSWSDGPSVKTDTLLYLPEGPNYTVTIRNGWTRPNQSDVVAKYTGGNLTLWVNDPEHPLKWHPNFGRDPLLIPVAEGDRSLAGAA